MRRLMLLAALLSAAPTATPLRERYRPRYHVTAPSGWLGEPAAFIRFHDLYHLFYQHYPADGGWGRSQWGHVVSSDLLNWTHYPPALLPRDTYDLRGCRAGSAVLHNDYLVLYYTGDAPTGLTQNVAISADGLVFQKYLYNPVLKSQAGVELRNPAVWRTGRHWHMVTAGSTAGHGLLVLHTSPDLYNWRYNRTLARSYGDLGGLWENPELFDAGGADVLILTARGVTRLGHRFRDDRQTGYVIGDFDHRHVQFDDLEISSATFSELDFGHDFHSAKSAVAADGRRLLVGLLAARSMELLEIEEYERFMGTISLVREMHVGRGGRLVTPPARELLALRVETMEAAWYSPGESFYAGVRTFELVVNATSALSDAVVSLQWAERGRYTVTYSAEAHYASVDRGGADSERRAPWAPQNGLYWRIFVDRSSVEVFLGDGEVVFSSRVYPSHALSVHVGGQTRLLLTQYRLRRTDRRNNNLQTDTPILETM